MTICTGINPSDIPCADLKLLELSLVARINSDLVMLQEVRSALKDRRAQLDFRLEIEEACFGAQTVELSSTEE
jgi:hypothetical protein